MDSKRKIILKRAAKGLAAILLTAAAGALGSADFRDFIGNDTTAAVLLAALPPLFLAAEKALGLRGK